MSVTDSLAGIVTRFGAAAKAKLNNPAASGAPEDQLRAPLEGLIEGLAGLMGLPSGAVVPVGESSLADLKTRPDYAVTLHRSLVGFIEVKAPGKGADPRRFHDRHDQEQWEKLRTLPNLIYTDGNAFSLWRDGALEGQVIHLDGDVATAGQKLADAVWDYEVSGKQVLGQWFSYRRRDRSRPIIGDRRPPSPLDRVQPDGWLAEYTTELLNVLHVLGRLVALEPRQADVLTRICDGALLSAEHLRSEGAFDAPNGGRSGGLDSRQVELLT